MNRFLLLAITFSLSFQVFANIILAEVDKETAFYSDYEQHTQIGKIKKGEVLEIISKAKAHSDDKNYWRFDLQVNKASIRVDYKGTAGYVDFFSLKSTRKDNISFLRRFSNKVLLPVYYCDALYHQDINYLIKFDPFIKNYDKGIKYFFVDDRKQEWIFNYPINYSFCNDLYLQIGSRPGRYFFNCFIEEIDKNSISLLIDTNYDQFALFEQLTDYESGKVYRIDYSLDGDYFKLSDKGLVIFEGAFIDKKAWTYIDELINQNKENKKSNSRQNTMMNDIRWPVHSSGVCDYNRKSKKID